MPTSTSPAPPSTTSPGANGGTFRVTASAADAQSGMPRSLPLDRQRHRRGHGQLEPVRDGLQLGRGHRRHRQPKRHRPKQRRDDERQRPFTLSQDSSAPTGQTLSLVGGPYYTSTSVSLTAGDGSDVGSGLDTSSRLYERDSATLTTQLRCLLRLVDDGLQPGYDGASGNCYRYRYSIADNVGNRSRRSPPPSMRRWTPRRRRPPRSLWPRIPPMPTSTSPAPPSTTSRAPTGAPSASRPRPPMPIGHRLGRLPLDRQRHRRGHGQLEPVRDGLQLGRGHRRHRQPKRHRPKQRRDDERQRALHAERRIRARPRPATTQPPSAPAGRRALGRNSYAPGRRRLGRRGHLLHHRRLDADHVLRAGDDHQSDRRRHLHDQVLLGRQRRQRRAGAHRLDADPHRPDRPSSAVLDALPGAIRNGQALRARAPTPARAWTRSPTSTARAPPAPPPPRSARARRAPTTASPGRACPPTATSACWRASPTSPATRSTRRSRTSSSTTRTRRGR